MGTTPQIDFSKYEQPAKSASTPQIDFSKYEEKPSKGLTTHIAEGAQEIGSAINPVNILKGMAQMTSHPIDTLTSDAAARQQILNKSQQTKAQANEEFSHGEYLKAMGDHLGGLSQAMYSMVPLVGPALESAGEDFQKGDYGKGAGKSIGIGLQLAGPKALSELRIPGAAGEMGATAIAPELQPRVTPGNLLRKTGAVLTDYAPKIGDTAGKIAERGGIAGAAFSAMKGDAAGVGEGIAGSIAAPLVRGATTKAATAIGSGTKWLGNLLSADASGIQPLPLTKSLLQKAGFYDRFLQSAEERPQAPAPYPKMDTAYSREPVNNQYQGPLQPSANQVPKRNGPLLLTGQTNPAGLPLLRMADETLKGVSRNNDIRAMNGESALNMILTGQDNANLIKIAKSRGIDVTKEVQLKAGKGDALLIKKITDSMQPEELDDIGARYIESNRVKNPNLGNIGPEAWKTLSLQTYFPDVKIPATVLKRTRAALDATQQLAEHKPLGSVMDTNEQPYYQAAAKATGKDFSDPSTVQLAQRLKDQDTDLAAVLEKNIQFYASKKAGQ